MERSLWWSGLAGVTACVLSTQPGDPDELRLQGQQSALFSNEAASGTGSDALSLDLGGAAGRNNQSAPEQGCYMDGPNLPEKFHFKRGKLRGDYCCFEDAQEVVCFECNETRECQVTGGDVGVRTDTVGDGLLNPVGPKPGAIRDFAESTMK